jgi:hypothetical protein
MTKKAFKTRVPTNKFKIFAWNNCYIKLMATYFAFSQTNKIPEIKTSKNQPRNKQN